MLFIISICLVCLLIHLFDHQIKKYAVPLYIVSILAAAGTVFYFNFGLSEYTPEFIKVHIVPLFSKGILGTAIFTAVMYTAVLDKKRAFTKKLYRIRGEISIIGCLLTLGHNAAFGRTIFVTLFTNPLSFETPKLIAAIISVILILLLLPLMITSFKCVRKKMQYKVWKSIQRLAYIFYALIYIHIMCLFIPRIGSGKLVDILIYSTAFISYFVLRITKYNKDKGLKAVTEKYSGIKFKKIADRITDTYCKKIKDLAILKLAIFLDKFPANAGYRI